MYGANAAAYYRNYSVSQSMGRAAACDADAVSVKKSGIDTSIIYRALKSISKDEPVSSKFSDLPPIQRADQDHMTALNVSRRDYATKVHRNIEELNRQYYYMSDKTPIRKYEKRLYDLCTRYVKNFSPISRFRSNNMKSDILTMLLLMDFSPNCTIPHHNGLDYSAMDYAMDIADEVTRKEAIDIITKFGGKSVLTVEQKRAANHELAVRNARGEIQRAQEEVEQIRSELVRAEQQLLQSQAKFNALIEDDTQSPTKRAKIVPEN